MKGRRSIHIHQFAVAYAATDSFTLPAQLTIAETFTPFGGCISARRVNLTTSNLFFTCISQSPHGCDCKQAVTVNRKNRCLGSGCWRAVNAAGFWFRGNHTGLFVAHYYHYGAAKPVPSPGRPANKYYPIYYQLDIVKLAPFICFQRPCKPSQNGLYVNKTSVKLNPYQCRAVLARSVLGHRPDGLCPNGRACFGCKDNPRGGGG